MGATFPLVGATGGREGFGRAIDLTENGGEDTWKDLMSDQKSVV